MRTGFRRNLSMRSERRRSTRAMAETPARVSRGRYISSCPVVILKSAFCKPILNWDAVVNCLWLRRQFLHRLSQRRVCMRSYLWSACQPLLIELNVSINISRRFFMAYELIYLQALPKNGWIERLSLWWVGCLNWSFHKCSSIAS